MLRPVADTVRRVKRRATRVPVFRALAALVRTFPLVVTDRSTALAVARAEVQGSRDPALLPVLDRALETHRTPALLRRRAEISETVGELTAARDAWLELAAGGNAEAARKARQVDGRLTETDPSWLPRVIEPGQPVERMDAASDRRILHLLKSSVPERWAGFTIRTMNNLRAQRDAGFDPVAVTEIGWPRVVGVTDFPAMVDVEGIRHYRLDRGPDYSLTRTPVDIRLKDNVADLGPVVREVRPAILHAHSGHRGGEHALMALALREQFGIPVVYEVRGLFEAVWTSDVGLAERSELFARRLAQETRILDEVDGVIAISEALADDMVARGIARDRITIVPNGIDPEAFGEPVRDEELRRRLRLDGRFAVGYVGNLDHWREGMDILISAIAELHRRGRTEVVGLIVGDGTGRADLEAHAHRVGIAEHIRFTGRVPHDEVAGYYAQFDLFTNPRVEERAARFITPLKPYEAMALGRPLLVSDLPALTEIVDPPNRGHAAAAGDPIALADAIAALMDDPAERERIATAGRDWVRTERTWAANGPRYRQAYERVLGPLAPLDDPVSSG